MAFTDFAAVTGRDGEDVVLAPANGKKGSCLIL
jgi:hypothetical protein